MVDAMNEDQRQHQTVELQVKFISIKVLCRRPRTVRLCPMPCIPSPYTFQNNNGWHLINMTVDGGKTVSNQEEKKKIGASASGQKMCMQVWYTHYA